MRSLGRVALVLAVLASGSVSAAETSWHHSTLAGHPLVGKIWSGRDHRFVGLSSLLTAVAGANYLLLGEKHDNRDHHRLQAVLTDAVYRSGRRPALAFEMMATDKQSAIDAYLAENPVDAGELGDRVGWRRTGWGPWARYRPIADAAVSAHAPIVAANLPQSRNRAVSRQGYSVLGDDLVKRTGLDRPFPDAMQAELETDIARAHCGQIPEQAIPAIARVQRARDAVMADSVASASHGMGAILVTGAGHARRDRGVPYYLRTIDPAASVISIVFREVEAGAVSVSEYEDTTHFDFVWFTPRVDNEDPCEQFKESLRRMNKTSN